MGIRNEEFSKGRDIYIDYDYEEILVRFSHSDRKFYSKLYGKNEERETNSSNSVIADAIRFGAEITAEAYAVGKSAS